MVCISFLPPDRYTGSASVFSAHIFNTALDDMGNMFNDLRLQIKLNSERARSGDLSSGTEHLSIL